MQVEEMETKIWLVFFVFFLGNVYKLLLRFGAFFRSLSLIKRSNAGELLRMQSSQ